MRASTFCIVARGDNPACPKLGESIASGCIPVIIMDQQLPFERILNYSSFSLQFDVSMVIKQPSIVREAIVGVTKHQIESMQAHLARVADYFVVRSTASPFSLQFQVIRQICESTPKRRHKLGPHIELRA